VRTLFVTRFMPYPLNSGGSQRVYHLLRAVASVSEVTLVCPTEGGQDCPELAALRSFCTSVHAFPLESFAWRRDARLPAPLRWARGKLRYLNLTQPALLQWFRSDEGDSLVSGLYSQGYDLVWAETLTLLSLLPRGLKTRVIVDLLDLEYRKLGYQLRHGPLGWMTPFNCLEYLKLRVLERRLLRLPYEFLVCSPQDRRALGTPGDVGNPGDAGRVWVVPNGVDLPADGEEVQSDPTDPTFVFVGVMGYAPNVDAVRFFVRRILPMLRREEPASKLIVVGKDPLPAVWQLHDGRTVVVTGAVPHPAPYLRRAAVIVVPIRFGGGTRTKILEAMAHGKPVVSTTVGAEGLEAEPGRHLLIADQPRDFAEACLLLLRNQRRREDLASEAYKLVRTKYQWVAIERLVRGIVRAETGLGRQNS
jgi:polysaccharide biosynthesis protein PslH